MAHNIHSRILASGIFVVLLMVASVAAQITPHTSPAIPGQQQTRSAPNRAAAENNPACQRIVAECKKLGYIVGQWKQDNGLWKDCFDPVVKGGTPTRDGRPETVPVSASDIQSCRAAIHHR